MTPRLAAGIAVILFASQALAQGVLVSPSLYREFDERREVREPVRALVALERPQIEVPRPQIQSDARALGLHIESTAQAFARAKQAVLVDLPGIVIERDFRHLPIVLVRIADRGRLEALVQRKGVRAINPVVAHRASVKESAPLVMQPKAQARGASGDGVAVVVVDTGADYSVKDLGECAAPGAQCPVAHAEDLAPEDNMRDDGSRHGTNVAAIIFAMAPKAKIIALDVFHEGYALKDKVIAAINWAVANRTKYNIVAINLSLGSQAYDSPCIESVYLDAFRQAISAGIVTVAASGNDAWPNAIEEPACAPNALSVGAVYDSASVKGAWSGAGCTDAKVAADAVPCFSNSVPFLKALAPGAMIEAGGVSMGGTSQAAAFVAGAVAALASIYRGAKPEALVEVLRRTGKAIEDHRTKARFPRINLDAAVEQAGKQGLAR